MPNFDGQYEVRLIYTTIPTGFPAMEHKMTFDVLPDGDVEVGTDFNDIYISIRAGTSVELDTFLSGLIVFIIPFYHATTSFARWELWYIPEGTTSATFI